MGLGLEWRLEGTKLEKDTPERPDVTDWVIGVVHKNFWGHVVWGTDVSFGEIILGSDHFSQPKVSHLDGLSRIQQEDVVWFDVSVDHDVFRIDRRLDLIVGITEQVHFFCFDPIVASVKGKKGLYKHLPYKLFRYTLLVLLEIGNHLSKITSITVFHVDVN